MLEAIFNVVTTGCQWRQFSRDPPAFTMVQGYFYRWIRDDREAAPLAGIIDGSPLKPQKMAGRSAMMPERKSKAGMARF